MTKPGLVLIVDDSEMNRTLLSSHMQTSGHDVMQAANGTEALELLARQPVDVVLLDLVMPELSGYEVLLKMQADDALRHIPVIMVSIMDDVDTIAECIEAGATDYLLKPFNSVFLQARLSSTLVRKRLHDAERAHMRELEARNEELDAFAATVAHDLKSPMTGILGFSDLALGLLEDHATEEVRQALTSITNIVERVDEMIQGLLLLARVPTASVVTEPVSTELVLYGVKMRLKHMIDKHQAEIVTPSEWPDVMGYEPWLAEVWANYLGNALKYGGRPPRVELGVTPRPDDKLRFWVRDNGPGIAAQDLDKLFKPFSRLNKKAKQKGHGLGLSIVQRIVRKLGGEVGVDSELGRGTTFWFELRAAPPTED